MTRPKCVGALLCRNEAAPDRYLERVLVNLRQFCTPIVVLDDGSTDRTASICREAACQVHERGGTGWWGQSGEHAARAELWDLAVAAAGRDGWILVADADMELLGIQPAEFQYLLRATTVNAWCWPLWDCWDSDQQMRVDGYWQAHQLPRPWLVRAVPVDNFVPEWHLRGIHCGHVPHNYPLVPGNAPEGVAWRHLSYVLPAHREKKARQYLNLPQIV